ncbi:hypothetical protein P43SY_000787 [Pythium insidiosum]|uniref:Telomere-associated protein Rif1 N-terminal domain-containing protein n=1 Tax=Pythium insidiosum TaxID=114742 RepID=A0AAD5QBF5_PYTIN|nr:hypothetical protein P43SY_000787 [Pythium insidiosum]
MSSPATDADADADAAPAPASSSAALRLLGIDGQTSMQQVLERDVLDELGATREANARLDAYLRLLEIFRLEDTPASVELLSRHARAVLREIHEDLRHATLPDVRHVALQALSYLLHQPTLAASLLESDVERVLSAVISLQASTQAEETYKLCLWSLAHQQLELPRHHAVVPQVVETLVLAIANPFKSRAVERKALEGLHQLVLRSKELMVLAPPTLQIWFRPVVSRLTSSDRATREQVVLLLSEATDRAVVAQWPAQCVGETMDVLREYALPAMQAHMTHERNAEALSVWRIVLVLMRPALAADVALLNELLYVPEISMRHADPSVRLLSMEAWHHLVDVFRQNAEWFFKKTMVALLLEGGAAGCGARLQCVL